MSENKIDVVFNKDNNAYTINQALIVDENWVGEPNVKLDGISSEELLEELTRRYVAASKQRQHENH